MESKIDNNLCSTATSCNGDNDERKIKCTKKRSVHFVCTNLPMYQLHLFFTKNYRGFACVNCVKVRKNFKNYSKSKEGSMIDTYKREVGACENIYIMVQKHNENKLINGIKKMKEKEKNNIQGKDLIDLIKNINSSS